MLVFFKQRLLWLHSHEDWKYRIQVQAQLVSCEALSLAGGCPLRLYLIFALYVTSYNDTGCAGVRATQWPHLNLERVCLKMRPLLGSWASTAESLTYSHTALVLMLMSLLLL